MEGNHHYLIIMTQQTLSGFQDLLGPTQFHQYPHPHTYQHGSEAQPQTLLPVEYMQEQAVSFVDYNENGRGKSLVSDDYAMNCAVTGVYGHIEVDKERGTLWQHSKWTEKMAKLLITAASYIAQYASAETGSGRTEASLLQKMGNGSLSQSLWLRGGYHVSPQQCEDKFNNVNKGYKRLIDLLGKRTSYKVVQNPKLLDEIYVPEKTREDVKKLLSSKQLFYEEMCSYHNGNQFYLPQNSDLEWSLQLALRKKDDYEPHSKWSKADDEQDLDAIADGQENEIDTEDIGGMFVFPMVPATISKKVNDHRVAEASNAKKSVVFNGILETPPQYGHSDSNPVSSEGDESNELQKQWMAFRSCRLKSQKLQVEAQLHKLEKQRFKWQGKCWKHDRELNKMRLQN